MIFCAKKTKRSTLFNLYFSSVSVFNAHSGVCDVCDAAKAGVVETIPLKMYEFMCIRQNTSNQQPPNDARVF